MPLRLLLIPFVLGCGGSKVVVFENDADLREDRGTDGGRDASADAFVDGGDASGSTCRGTIERQCAMSRETFTLCFENTAGCPGDIVEMQIFALGPPGCDTMFQTTAGGQNLPTHRLLNFSEQITPIDGRCIRREEFRDGLDWGILPGSATGADCVEEFPTGLLDVVRFEIAEDAPPGDYMWTEARGRIFSNNAACGPDTFNEGVVVFPTFRIAARP